MQQLQQTPGAGAELVEVRDGRQRRTAGPWRGSGSRGRAGQPDSGRGRFCGTRGDRRGGAGESGVLRADYGQSGAVQDFNESGIVNAQGDSLPQDAVSWGPLLRVGQFASAGWSFSVPTLPHGGCQ